MSDLCALYGTDVPPVIGQKMQRGPWSFTYEAGGLRHIHLNGHEAIRSIAFLVRDSNWGTLVPKISHERISDARDALRLSYDARYESDGARLDVVITIEVKPDAVYVAAKGRTTGAFKTNRAGFTVLHPITGVAGAPVRVTHSDGSVDAASFPDLIDPWQPFMDITGLTHHVGDATVSCQFDGDTFEMEDQRQWGDASFKTYNRPLAKPWPYVLDDGETLAQSVTLRWEAHTAPARAAPPSAALSHRFPQTALVITPDDARRLAAHPQDITAVHPQRLLCHLDATAGDTAHQFRAFAAAQEACRDVLFDLELICACDGDPTLEMTALSQDMGMAGLKPASIMVCPSVDRQSTPPGSDWPLCPPLETLHAAAAAAFAGVTHGGGMVSFFPELNRKRPPVAMLDFVSHGLCPIVHAADDLSVMETLEAIPHITRSARAIIGDRAYRIGPATIAMRQNPYGQTTIANPTNDRVCMTDNDPRHRGRFGAAYALGLATALAPADIAVWTPAALYGPRGVVAEGRDWPISTALKTVAGLAGQPVHDAKISDGLASLIVGSTKITANLTAAPNGGLEAYAWRATT